MISNEVNNGDNPTPSEATPIVPTPTQGSQLSAEEPLYAHRPDADKTFRIKSRQASIFRILRWQFDGIRRTGEARFRIL
jgi:hypothetical protein